MANYVARRLLGILPMMLAVSLVIFFFAAHAAWTIVDSLLEKNPSVTNDARSELEREYGLDRALPVQYVLWLKGMFIGEFGQSFVTHEPVSNELKKRSLVTLQLTAFALIYATLLGVLLGYLSRCIF